MASPRSFEASAVAGESLEQRFHRLAAIWEAETGIYSNPGKICSHPAWSEIVGMGDEAIPLLLREIEKGPSLWVWALSEITGENPASPEISGNIKALGDAWLEWGRAKGYR